MRRRLRPVVRVEEVASMAPYGEPVAVSIRRSSARRTLALRVTDPGEVVVNAPLGMRLDLIEQFVQRHGEWLRAHRQRARETPFTWHDGMSLPWLGESLTLTQRDGARTPIIEADQLCCSALPERLEATLLAWYWREARRALAERLALQCSRLGRPVPSLRISNARTRWGSLSASGGMSLNWRLIKASLAEIDYVICHELAHQRHRNHSPAFWREVARLDPDYAAARLRLRERGRAYFQF